MSIPTPKLETYDLQNLILNFGLISIEGFGSDDVLKISKLKNSFSSIEGLHGAIVPIMSKDRRAQCEIKVMRESDNNASLSIISALDQISGLGVFPFLAIYPNQTQVFSSVQSRVVRDPDDVFSKKNGYLTWILELYNYIRFG